MFTYNHVVAHRAKVVKAVLQSELVGLLVADGSLETDEERVREDFPSGRGNQQRRSQALQPHHNSAATGGRLKLNFH